MELIFQQLQQRGYDVSFEGNDIKLKLAGLANPVWVTHDVVLNQYKLKTRDVIMGVFSSLLLFSGVYGLSFSHRFSSAFLIAVSAFGFLKLVLTELKLITLRKYLESLNLKQA
ncbi:hypothetical protein [Shewanella sp. UCD-KL21]|uniref:hypothetical protein n=1 Tax=Shewanella sp. UCD-KL21 TaxID=1917164 RepID=UPI0009712415|nr:hypothetical protein [Shewanella sp. UCD-KL21]